MKWLFAIWRLRKVPTVRELPGLYLRASVFGALAGPLFQFGLGAVAGLWRQLYSPEAFALSGFIGAVFACCFFTAHGIGNAVVRRFTACQPRTITGTIFIGYNALAAPLA